MLYFSICFIFLLKTTTASAALPSYTPTDYILLNCGSSTNLNQSSRNWDGDQGSKYASSDAFADSLALPASSQGSVETVPYMTARIFRSQFTYTFPVLTGPKFLRLYFYPNTYSNYTTTQSFFTVSVNNYTLLKNFSGQFNSPSPMFKKEYLLNVEENQRIDLTFSPNENSFAFINGIEIVSVPDKLYFRGNNVMIKSGKQMTYLHSDTILENLYRLNVGGMHVNVQDDTGMFRAWEMDDDYIFSANIGYTLSAYDVLIKYSTDTPDYTAPEIVYATSRVMSNHSRSLEWHFPVDSGFYYLHRFHFCETDWLVTNVNQRVFTIQMDGETLEIDADVFTWTKGSGIPIYKDYITWVPDHDGSRGTKELNLSLFPFTEGNPMLFNALLNGLEIFKLSDMNTRSLAAANPLPSSSGPDPTLTPPKRSNNSRKVVYYVLGSVFGLIALVIVAISFLVFRKDSGSGRTKLTKSLWIPISRLTMRTNGSGSGSSLPSNLCRHFLLDEMKSATHNFDDNFVIGKGGFGKVYQGYVDNGATRVAIKRLNTSSNQGVHEFLTEISMLSKLRHRHLVSLLGYCDENKEMILVYEFMSNGTLREHLYNSENLSLTWKQRLRICIGAAKGLHYLHTSAKHTIIHRDVKSTNILLDEKWVAKVSDFGLSRVGPTDGLQTHVSTLVKGSFGYLDPEYYRRKQLTEKSDVYSFGVVLLEVLCARPPIIQSLPKDKVNLAEWAKICNKKGTLEETIIDPNIKEDIAPECLNKYVETALMCLRDKGTERPTMSDIVGSLEFAIQLQEAADKRDIDDDSSVSPLRKSSFPLLWDAKPFSTDEEGMFTGSSEGVFKSKSSGSLFSSGEVFSEILHPSVR